MIKTKNYFRVLKELILFRFMQGNNARKVISDVVRIFCTAVYCLWALMYTQDGCHSLTWDPSFT